MTRLTLPAVLSLPRPGQRAYFDPVDAHRDYSVLLAPSNSGVLVELAALRLERQADGELIAADSLVDRALELAPNNPNARILRTELLALQGGIEEALAVYRDVLNSAPRDHPQRKLWEARAQVLGQE